MSCRSAAHFNSVGNSSRRAALNARAPLQLGTAGYSLQHGTGTPHMDSSRSTRVSEEPGRIIGLATSDRHLDMKRHPHAPQLYRHLAILTAKSTCSDCLSEAAPAAGGVRRGAAGRGGQQKWCHYISFRVNQDSRRVTHIVVSHVESEWLRSCKTTPALVLMPVQVAPLLIWTRQRQTCAALPVQKHPCFDEKS